MNNLEQYFSELFDNKKPENLYQPISYILLQGGKRLRPLLVNIASDMFDGDKTQVQYIAAAFEMLHNFTLIHDDIMDEANVRRGKPTVYKKWNSNIAILSGDALAVAAMQQLLKLDCEPNKIIKISEIFTQTAIEICEGQQYDLDFETTNNVSIDQYLDMIRLKTAVMFAGCLKSGAIYADADAESIEALYDLGIHLGIAFQLEDDLLDVYADSDDFGKTVGNDIKDNKKTFLYIKALELADSEQKQILLDSFSTKNTDNDEKFATVKSIFDAINIKSETEKSIKYYSDLCIADIQRINATEDKKQPVIQLVNQLQKRSK